MPCKFDAMPNHNESAHLFAERAKLGPDDNRLTTFGEMASHFEIFGMLFDAYRGGEADSSETSEHIGLE